MALIKQEDRARGERIKRLMNRQGWTDSSLSDELGCDPSTVWRWRSGLSIAANYVGPLVEALGTTREWIVSGPAEDDEDDLPIPDVASHLPDLASADEAQDEQP